MADLIEEHRAIWRDYHESDGISLAESKADWLNLLREDPNMAHSANWGDLAGNTTEAERSRFKTWLEGDET